MRRYIRKGCGVTLRSYLKVEKYALGNSTKIYYAFLWCLSGMKIHSLILDLTSPLDLCKPNCTIRSIWILLRVSLLTVILFVSLWCSILSKSVLLKLGLDFEWRRKFKGYTGAELSFIYLVIHEASCLFKGSGVIC